MEVLNKPRPGSAKILSFDVAMANAQQSKQTPQQAAAAAEASAVKAEKAARAAEAATKTLAAAVAVTATPPSRWQQYQQIISTFWPLVVVLLTAGGFVLHLYVKDQINEGLVPFNAELQKQGLAIAEMSGEVKELNQKIDRANQAARLFAQGKEVKKNRPGDVLAGIRANLSDAEKHRQKLPVPQLADYKKQVQAVPRSEKDYWVTVAAVINYQSFLNQLNLHAPDPDKVARRCPLYTQDDPNSSIRIQNNVMLNTQHVNGCIVDLDTNGNTVLDAVISDSVVHYHGGKINFLHAIFINCRFVVDIGTPTAPSRPDLLLALMNSDQIKFTVSAAG